MADAIGVIKDDVSDKRSGKLVFLSHCMLNQNACVRGIASQPAVIREIVDLALEHDIAMYQMPCPENTYVGSMRWGLVKKMYGNPMFRRHCRRIAELICDQVQTYRDNGHDVKGIVLRDGSPTCGLHTAAVEADDEQQWGGMVWNASPRQRFAPTEGVYVEELMAELAARGMDDVRLLSVAEVPEAGPIPEQIAELERVFAGTAPTA
jgi:predicted secreted protein